MNDQSKSRALRNAVKRTLSAAAGALIVNCAVTIGGTTFSSSAYAAELPKGCDFGVCGSQAATWVTSGSAMRQQFGNTLNIDQLTNNVVLNWQSFNISSDATVNFRQPDSSSVALNRIFQADASRIFGSLNANGRVYLINQNGFLFGSSSKLNVGGLLASSLNIAPDAIENGILYPASNGGKPAFQLFPGSDPTGRVEVEPGARIETAENGQVLMFAPEVINRGTIHTPGGQTVLAAGDSVYLLASGNSNLRGVLVEVGLGGCVTNGGGGDCNPVGSLPAAPSDPSKLVGEIIAERGNVTLAGLAVNQLGRVSATTSVRVNGSIRLQARDGGRVQPAPLDLLATGKGGQLVVGQNSVTEVMLDDQDGKTVDVNTQPRSDIYLDGSSVQILDGSRITAPGGNVTITASNQSLFGRLTPSLLTSIILAPTDARVYIAPGAGIDVSGASAVLPMERNSLRVELRGTQLADSPQQRDGVLRGETAYVDVRAAGTRSDGTSWVGSPLADLSGDVSNIERDVFERNSLGGTIAITSQGDSILAPTSTLNVSGGTVRYLDGYVLTTQFVGADGRIYDARNADRDRQYTGIASGYSAEDPRWGVSRSYSNGVLSMLGTFERGYDEGKDAGGVAIIAPRGIVDGDIVGDVTAGRYQRSPTQTLPSGQIFRAYNQVPVGAQLTLGNAVLGANFILRSAEFASGFVFPTLTNSLGQRFNPLGDPLPASADTLKVRGDLLGDDGVQRLKVFANGSIKLPSGHALTLAPGGEVTLTASSIAIDSDITAPSGAIKATAVITQASAGVPASVKVGDGVHLDTSAQWINDHPLLNPLGLATAPLWIDGGSIALSSQLGSLTLSPNSVLDVSAGAWRQLSGAIVGGSAGAILVEATPFVNAGGALTPTDLRLGGEFRGYALNRGGSLTIRGNEVCISSQTCAAADGLVRIAPEFFTTGGFANFDIASNLRGLTVAPSVQIRPRQTNYAVDPSAALRPSSADFDSLAIRRVLADIYRAPVNLSLAAGAKAGAEPYTASTFLSAPNLSIGTGASIVVDPTGQIQLQSNTRLINDGLLQANAGAVTLRLDGSLAINEFLPSQGIWLGAHGAIDVSGVARTVTDDLNRVTGSVLDGGSVTVRADRGYFIAMQGSAIDISGTSAALDLRTSATTIERSEAASKAGQLGIATTEGVVLNATLSAHAGADDLAGGKFALTVDVQPRDASVNGSAVKATLPFAARTISVTDSIAPIVIAPGANVPNFLNGTAAIDADQLKAAGFDFLSLTARNTLRYDSEGNQFQGAYGRIDFNDGVTLSARGRVQLDAPILGLTGDSAKIESSYVQLANLQTSQPWDQSVNSLQARLGMLNVRGNLIDVIGAVGVERADRVRLESSGDIRLRGVIAANADTRYSGSLTATGDLELSSAALYPASFTDFAIRTTNLASGEIAITSSSSGSSVTPAVLSAAGHLTVSAPAIRQSGTVLAPFGAIDLQAGKQLTLEPGSLVSTAAGATIPLGTTQGGIDWTYQVGARTAVFGSNAEFPEQRIALNGDRIDFKSGAKIDVSAGGDLQAYEFIKGVGGTRDVLANDVRPNQFAILPTLDPTFAPFDAAEYAGSSLLPGDSIYLSGVPGLEAGTYALLPARYALLPGAYLVTAVKGYEDLSPGEQIRQLDGSTVISGYKTLAGTGIRDARTGGFSVRLGSDVQRQAQYDLSGGAEFFARRAAELERALPRLPTDAGNIAFIAGSALTLGGSLSAAAPNGRGAAVDLAGSNLRLVQGSQSSSAGIVTIDTSQLSRLGAESIFVGGRRSTVADGTALAVTATTVEVESGVSLSAPELLLAATNSVRVKDGATLTASGSAADGTEQLVLSGDSAFLRLSQADQVLIKREESGPPRVTGTLDVHPNARLVAPNGSVTADSSLDTISLGRLDLTGGSLSITASRMSLGATPAGVSGLILDTQQIAGLGLRELALNSRSTIDLYGDVRLTADRDLTLNAGGLFAAAPGVNATLVGKNVTLGNALNATASATAGNGHLLIQSEALLLGEGKFRLTGFATSRIEATNRIEAQSDGSMFATGELSLAAPRLIGSGGAHYSYSSDAALKLLSAGSTSASSSAVSLGSRLDFTGSDVTIGTRIEAPSGVVEILATRGDVEFANGGAIIVSGSESMFDGVAVPSAAGRIAVSSDLGSIRIASGSSLDARAATDGMAGRVSLNAANGNVAIDGDLHGDAGTRDASGEFFIDAQSFGSLDALNQTLARGGFFAHRSVHQRGIGDLVLADTSLAWTAQQTELTADAGGIRMQGVIDGSGAKAGSAVLAARDSVVLTGDVRLGATAAGEHGGRLELDAAQGGVFIASTAHIDVFAGVQSGAEAPQKGDVHVRVPVSAANTLLDTDATNDRLRLDGVVTGARAVTVEGFQSYARTSLTATDYSTSSQLFTDASNFATNASTILTGLGHAGDAVYRVVPGIEIDSVSSLTLSGGGTTAAPGFNLRAWRFNGLPGVLTLRAQGDLNINNSISDGFDSITTFKPLVRGGADTESWSYRLVAGADLSSSAPLATSPLSTRSEVGNFTLAAGTATSPRMIRTGTGRIDIAAANDFVLSADTSVIYTAGQDGGGIKLAPTTAQGGLAGLDYPIGGGSISILAGGDIKSVASKQLVTDWLWRAGGVRAAPANESSVAWTVNFRSFQQGVAALGGGDIDVMSGGDITNFSASIPTIGRQRGGTTLATSAVDVIAGGDLHVVADDNLLGGSFYVGLGTGTVSAGDRIGSTKDNGGNGIAPLLVLGNGVYAVNARDDLSLQTIANATLLPFGAAQSPGTSGARTYFSTYAAESSVSLASSAGNVSLAESSVSDVTTALSTFRVRTSNNIEDSLSLTLLPPRLRAIAHAGDVNLGGSISLFPAPLGNLELFAAQDVNLSSSATDLKVIVSDADPLLALPTLQRPERLPDFFSTSFTEDSTLALFHAAVPLHDVSRRPAGASDDPVRIVARSGSVVADPLIARPNLYFPKPTRIVAGEDILNLSLIGQHTDANDITSLIAGRDLAYDLARTDFGRIAPDQHEIRLSGPGQLDIRVGRNFNLQASTGITTIGATKNAALPKEGADVSVIAGLGATGVDNASFIDRYFVVGSSYDADLIDFVEARTGQKDLIKKDALDAFRSMRATEQQLLVERTFFNELRLSGRSAAQPGPTNKDFSRGFKAIETLFPGTNLDGDAGASNPYLGDINLYFSQIYTLRGGDIFLAAPGGRINAGLATPPSSFGIAKQAAQLGLVVQQQGDVNAYSYSDFAVNESRVFAADGGSILVWSTQGDIDAGRGAKTAISAPPPQVTIDEKGQITLEFPPALFGSGIQTLATTEGRKPGNVDLFAPHGVVNANDAGIVAGNLTIAATAVLGQDNIKVSGVSVGVPVDTSGLGASLAGVSAASSAATNAATADLAAAGSSSDKQAPIADTALSWLEVFVLGLGEETCKQDDIECLKRQK